MRHVYLLINPEKDVVAIYDNEEMALKLKSHIETKLNTKLTIEKRSVNLDLGVIGVFK
jgi:hypothetical protein